MFFFYQIKNYWTLKTKWRMVREDECKILKKCSKNNGSGSKKCTKTRQITISSSSLKLLLNVRYQNLSKEYIHISGQAYFAVAGVGKIQINVLMYNYLLALSHKYQIIKKMNNYSTWQVVGPKKEKLAEAEAELAVQMGKLNEKRAELKEVKY